MEFEVDPRTFELEFVRFESEFEFEFGRFESEFEFRYEFEFEFGLFKSEFEYELEPRRFEFESRLEFEYEFELREYGCTGTDGSRKRMYLSRPAIGVTTVDEAVVVVGVMVGLITFLTILVGTLNEGNGARLPRLKRETTSENARLLQKFKLNINMF